MSFSFPTIATAKSPHDAVSRFFCEFTITIRKCNYNSLLPCAATNFANSKNCHLNNLKVENFIVANCLYFEFDLATVLWHLAHIPNFLFKFSNFLKSIILHLKIQSNILWEERKKRLLLGLKNAVSAAIDSNFFGNVS